MPDKCNGETIIFNATDPGKPDPPTTKKPDEVVSTEKPDEVNPTVKPDPPTTKKPDGVNSTEKPDEVNLTEKPDDGSNSTEIPNSCILPQLFWAILLAVVYSRDSRFTYYL